MASRNARLLIVDDEVSQMRALCDTLAEEGFSTEGVASGQDALTKLAQQDFDLVLTDLMMPGMDGISLLREAHTLRPGVVGIVMTGQGSINSAVEAMQAGALDYIQKPFRLNLVLPVIRRAIAVRDLRLANAELEQRVQARTVELEAANASLEIANQDLEAFSFSVSHDLRAPLRAITGLLEIYEEKFGATIPADGRQLFETVQQSGARMHQLIDDLLHLSRLGRQHLTMLSVPMALIAGRVVKDIVEATPERPFEITVGELPECTGDPSLMEQVWVNLLSNAAKFTRGRNPARIDVGSAESPTERIYFVRDNGAGFDPTYAQKLFGVFQRLHSGNQFEGTGIGLSIVDRIVKRHGGRVWAEGKPDSGATFYFSVPILAITQP